MIFSLMKYIDIHTHANLVAFKEDYDAVIHRALDAGVFLINVGTEFATSRGAVELLAHYPEGVYATVGLHPTHAGPSFHDENESDTSHEGEVFDYDAYKALASHPKVVALGECGLDYFRVTDPALITKQKEIFEQHIALANELQKPLMLHIRSGEGGNAYKDAQAMLKSQAKVRGNSHFFAGSLEDARGFWDMGYSTSFTGVLTFARNYDEVVRAAPADLIHAETDAPYVAPVPYRGKRNEPLYVIEVVKKMAELRGVSIDDWSAQLTQNARKAFNI
jgi:TatD DNase family protein